MTKKEFFLQAYLAALGSTTHLQLHGGGGSGCYGTAGSVGGGPTAADWHAQRCSAIAAAATENAEKRGLFDKPDVAKAHEAFANAAEPLMKLLAENYNPHSVVIVTATGAELLTGELTHNTEKFLVD